MSNAAPTMKDLERAMIGAYDAMNARITSIQATVRDIEQRGPTRAPISGGLGTASEVVDTIHGSEGFKAFMAGNTNVCNIPVPSRLIVQNSAITNPSPLSNDNPLVPAQRGALVAAPLRRPTIRALFSQVPVSGNLIEVPSEASFTNNARPQGDTSPVGNGEGEQKAQSAMTFTLSSFPVVTIAHYMRCSRQVLSDAAMLKSQVDRRLLQGLGIEEEDEMLTGDGGANTMRGLNSFATAFTGGVTNANAIDTIARAIDQLQSGSNYEVSGIIMNPTDWLAITLLKDSQGRYLLGNPANVTVPMLWGKPVIVTAAQTLGQFTVLDAPQAGYVADRETANIRVSENVNDDFTRNMVVILAEQRTVLVVEQPTAIVRGAISHAG